MRKLLILAVLLIGCNTLQAQDWKDALTKVATSAADKATGGKLTQMAITGQWEYSGPGVKFESDDTLSELGGSALSSSVEKKLDPVYRLAGIKPGACHFTFDTDGAFEALLGTHSLNGTYEFNPETHAITLHFSKAPGKLGSLTRPCLPERLTDATGPFRAKNSWNCSRESGRKSHRCRP